MKILITGATGFIGSELASSLRERGHEVWEMVRYVSGGRFNFYNKEDRVFVDLRDSGEIRNVVINVSPAVIIHLAAQSAVSYSFSHPEEVNDVIYMGTVRLANAAKDIGCTFIHASSSEVYGRGDHIYPLTEEQRIGGTSPYAAAKVAAEEYLNVMADIYKMPLIILRPFNTIGRALIRNRHFVVERTICQAIEEGKIHLHDYRPLRDFMFRTDHVRAYLKVVENLEVAKGHIFNVCTGGCWSIREMAEHVASQVRYYLKKDIEVMFTEEPDRPLDIPKLQGSYAKTQRLLGWEPQYNISQAIEKAVEEWIHVLGYS